MFQKEEWSHYRETEIIPLFVRMVFLGLPQINTLWFLVTFCKRRTENSHERVLSDTKWSIPAFKQIGARVLKVSVLDILAIGVFYLCSHHPRSFPRSGQWLHRPNCMLIVGEKTFRMHNRLTLCAVHGPLWAWSRPSWVQPASTSSYHYIFHMCRAERLLLRWLASLLPTMTAVFPIIITPQAGLILQISYIQYTRHRVREHMLRKCCSAISVLREYIEGKSMGYCFRWMSMLVALMSCHTGFKASHSSSVWKDI